MTVPKPPSKEWAHGSPPKNTGKRWIRRTEKVLADPLDIELEKLTRAEAQRRIPEEIKVRLQEKFPQKPNAQIGWVLRQMEALKDTFLDGADSPKNLHIAPLIQYRATLVSIRDTLYLRDHGPARKGRPSVKDPLKGLLSAEQEQEISKARKNKNGAANEEEA